MRHHPEDFNMDDLQAAIDSPYTPEHKRMEYLAEMYRRVWKDISDIEPLQPLTTN